MKQFSCGEIVPDCKAIFQAEHEQAILSLVAEHARPEHGISPIPVTLVDPVCGRVPNLPASLA